MENSSNDNQSKKKVNQPQTVYKSKSTTNEVDAFEHLPNYVKERLELALQQSEKGLGKPHAQVMAETKRKFNLSF